MNLVRQLTTAIFFIHALIGCCWHHDHVCTAATDATAWEDPAVCCEHSHHQGCHGVAREPAGESPDEDSDHQHACQGDRCFFVRAEGAQLPPSAEASATLPAVASLFEQPQPAAGAGCEFLSYDGSADAPLRRHLLYQVLLI